MELISHHLCPFLHRSVMVLARKGLVPGRDFTVTRVPIYDLPPRLFALSPKGSMPVLVTDDNQVLLRSLAINEFFNDTLGPDLLPADAFERAQHRAMLITLTDLLNQMRDVYTAKDEPLLEANLTKLFQGLRELEVDLQPIIAKQGQHEVQMIERGFATLFALMLHFERIQNDERWATIPTIRQYADSLLADSLVNETRSPDYDGEFSRFFGHFGSAFAANKDG